MTNNVSTKSCMNCKAVFFRKEGMLTYKWKKRMTCGKSCASILARAGKMHSLEAKEKMRRAKLLNPTRYWLGKELPQHVRDAQIKVLKNKTGALHHNWIADRALLKKSDRQVGSAYNNWVSQAKMRDGFKCKIGNKDCYGQLEVHHILRFNEYPELRYELTNAITLCHYHHPRKKTEEQRLVPIFRSLIGEVVYD